MKYRKKIYLNEEELLRLKKMHHFEHLLWKKGAKLIAGVDEAGRGPLAGPVVAAVVVIKDELLIPGLNDSKCVRFSIRSSLVKQIKEKVPAWSIGIVPPHLVDLLSVHQATFLAMKQAIEDLTVTPDHVLVDGWPLEGISISQTPLVKGDSRSAAIAAASLIAKTARDFIMVYYSRIFRSYGFERHKGYATREHLAALQKNGPCIIHRHSFKGVKELYLK